MADIITISVDAMGGDHGPPVTLAGAALALGELPDTRYRLYGEEAAIRPVLAELPALAAAATVIDCEVTVKMTDKPSQALRRGRWKSSMWRSIEAVKDGSAAVAVSAGNTGALMAMSRFCLRTMAGVDRPAIAGLWPTLRGDAVVLDMGASIGADAQQLVDCAVMGGAMARTLFGKERPTVGLLNIGVEEVKGLEEVRIAGQMLKEADMPHIDYVGFVEGDDIGKGTADVVVTEGFSGNIALKTAEGTARQISFYLREEMGRTLRARLGYLLARPAFQALRHRLDPGRSNGGVFLGLNGIVIKSHGGADAAGFASAVKQGYAMVRNELQAKIEQDLALFRRGGTPPRSSEPSPAGAA